MPDILYVYKCPAERTEFHKSVGRKANPKKNGGQIVYEQWPKLGKRPRALLDYPLLPDRIGTQESWWVYEAWRRLDPRISWNDIHMRQYGPNRGKEPNTLQRFVGRNRRDAFMIRWTEQFPGLKSSNEKRRKNEYEPLDSEGKPLPKTSMKGKKRNSPTLSQSPTEKGTIKGIDIVTPRMSDAQKAANTTRGLTPGLIDPSKPDTPDNRIPWPEQNKRAGVPRPKSTHGGKRQDAGEELTKNDEAEMSSTDDEGEDGFEWYESSEESEYYGDPQEESSGQSPVHPTGMTAAHPTGTFQGSPSYGPHPGMQFPPFGNFQTGNQIDAFQALEPIPPIGSFALGGPNSWSDPSTQQTGAHLGFEEDMYGPETYQYQVQQPVLDMSAFPHFPPPQQTTDAWIPSQPMANTPVSINDPSHPYHIPPRAPRTLSTMPTQGGVAALNPRAPSFVPHHTPLLTHHLNHPAPAATNASPPHPSTNRPRTHTSSLVSQHTPLTPTVPIPQPAPSEARVPIEVRRTCPDNMTPARWQEFLDYCLAHGIGRDVE
ncbi:MAG: hypothetical protein Q9168_003683 [Polycauliona sp. 1 TL-2023]